MSKSLPQRDVAGLMSLSPTISKIEFTWNPNGTLATSKHYDTDSVLLYTVTYTWNPDGTLNKAVRT